MFIVVTLQSFLFESLNAFANLNWITKYQLQDALQLLHWFRIEIRCFGSSEGALDWKRWLYWYELSDNLVKAQLVDLSIWFATLCISNVKKLNSYAFSSRYWEFMFDAESSTKLSAFGRAIIFRAQFFHLFYVENLCYIITSGAKEQKQKTK